MIYNTQRGEYNKLQWLFKNIYNNLFVHKHKINYVTKNGLKFRIEYYRFCYFYSDKFTIKNMFNKLNNYHYNVCEIFSNGGSCEVDWGTCACTSTFQIRKLMKYKLKHSAEYWEDKLNA